MLPIEIENALLLMDRIKVHPARKNITQEQLASELAVSRQTINSIEKNRYVPSTLLALKLSRFFETSVNEIFELDENE